MAKNKNVYEQITKAGREGIDNLNRLDEAYRKFRRSDRRSSIIKASQGNVFEFPVFVSSSIPLDYAIASNALLEQIYASYLQFAISVNPIQNVDAVKNGLQFGNYKVDVNKYLEYTDMTYAHDACHAEYEENGYIYEFSYINYLCNFV